MYHRVLEMDLPLRQSAFLWGARQTGKSTYLRERFPEARYYDFLDTDLMISMSSRPAQLREQVLAMDEKQLQHPIIIDEVQKVPLILDEVHWLIENTNAYFILCGSSARKLKRGAANLLGGRAWRFEFYPLVFPEIPDFDLLKALNNGLIPRHYQEESAVKSLDSYIKNYLKEEIQEEGVTRDLPAFARFLDVLAFSHGQQIVHTNIARDCGVSATTVKAYFQILIDTLLGYEIYPYSKKVTRDIITATPKFYLFDVGVVNSLAARSITALKGAAAEEAFEHYIFMELKAYAEINETHGNIAYWRTKTGLEVDFILGHGQVAIEIKINSTVEKHHLKGLTAFAEEHKPERAIVVSQDKYKRLIQVENGTDIEIYPWREFLTELWEKSIRW